MNENIVKIDNDISGASGLMYEFAVENMFKEYGKLIDTEEESSGGRSFINSGGMLLGLTTKTYLIQDGGMVKYYKPHDLRVKNYEAVVELIGLEENESMERKIREGLEKVIKAEKIEELKEFFPEGAFDTA